MQNQEKTWLVVNSASGSNDEDRVRSVVEALRAQDAEPARIVDLSVEKAPTRDNLADVGQLVVFTGDGSINSVVNGVDGWGGRVLILPGGTANLLAKALHGERDAAAIVSQIAALKAVRRNAIRSSAGSALIELLAGPGAKWSEVREELREGDLTETAGRVLDAARESIAGPMVVVSNPRLGREGGYAGVRLEVADGGCLVSGYVADSIADYLRQGVALLKRDFREGPHDELGSHARISCHSTDGSPMPLMIDGERLDGLAHETFSLAPLAVDLLSSVHG